MLLLVALAAFAEDPWFYPSYGDEIATIVDGRVGDLEVRLTGVVLARAQDPDALRALPEVANLQVLAGDGHVVKLSPRSGVDPVAFSRVLHSRPDVAWAHPDLVLPTTAHTLPDDPYVAAQWHLVNTGQRGGTPGVDVDADIAWALSTGAGTTVAVLDTGVFLDHPDLVVIPGHDYPDGDEDPSPEVGGTGRPPHGTNVAGLSAAQGNNDEGVAGVAYDAEVYAIRWLGGPTTIAQLYEAFVEAADNADVINNSWGFGDDCPEFPTYGGIQDGLDYAEASGRGGLGTVVVTSAGNGGCDFSGDGFQKHPAVISVAAIDRDDNRIGYSSYGPLTDIAAPSGGVLTTDMPEEGYGSYDGNPYYYQDMTGTSASAPIVSGVVALMIAANPRVTAADVRDVLCETATRNDVFDNAFDDRGWSQWVGCGRVDAGAAVAAVANVPPLAPEPTGPPSAVFTDRVVLQWEPASDADRDLLAYEVRWWPTYAPNAIRIVPVDGTHLDLTADVWNGAEIAWTVQAIDPWGPGPTSAESTFTATDRPVEEDVARACTTAPSSAWLGLLIVALLRRRR